MQSLKDKIILVTGGTGSFGNKVPRNVPRTIDAAEFHMFFAMHAASSTKGIDRKSPFRPE
ncbi:MAG: hypothetical protein ABSE89_05585 [Sedimentisphaerales bacterium]